MSAPRVLAEPRGPGTAQGSYQLSTTSSSLPEALLTSHPPSSCGHSGHPGSHRPHPLLWPHVNLSTTVPTPCLGNIWGNGAPNPSWAESSPQTSPSTDAEPVLLWPRLCSPARAPRGSDTAWSDHCVPLRSRTGALGALAPGPRAFGEQELLDAAACSHTGAATSLPLAHVRG